MSGRLSNLSLNRVDASVHRTIVDLLDRERDEPGGLEAFLLGLDLRPTDSDRYQLECLENGRLPPSFEYTVLVRLLRVDPPRFAPRIAAIVRGEAADQPWKADSVRAQVLELAFPGGSTRWYGDLWLTEPAVVLAWFSPCFREYQDSQLRSPGFAEELAARLGPSALAPPASIPPGERAVELAMGGLDAGGEPLDALHDPAAVAALASDLAAVDLDEHPRGAMAIFRFAVEEYSPHVLEDVAGDSLDERLAAFCRDECRSLLDFYREAAGGGFGVDVCWHPNP